MIISGLEIKNMLNKEIFIEPFDDSRLNPNSYNLRLHNELLVYDSHVLDMKVKNETKTISIPPEGLVLEPGIVYLGRTVEYQNPESCPDARRQIVDRTSGNIYTCHRRFRRRGFFGLLDFGDILYSTGTDISERRNMSNILSYDFRRLLQNV